LLRHLILPFLIAAVGLDRRQNQTFGTMPTQLASHEAQTLNEMRGIPQAEAPVWSP
jgi:hypothetical protein